MKGRHYKLLIHRDDFVECYRGKNAPTRRKLRSNRLHVSRRVRRKHRRVA